MWMAKNSQIMYEVFVSWLLALLMTVKVLGKQLGFEFGCNVTISSPERFHRRK